MMRNDLDVHYRELPIQPGEVIPREDGFFFHDSRWDSILQEKATWEEGFPALIERHKNDYSVYTA